MKSRTVLVAGLASLALLAAPFTVNAQMTLGVGASVVSATWSGSDADDTFGSDIDKGSRIGFAGGAWLSIPVAGRLSIVPGVHLVQKGVKYSDDADNELAFKVNYFEIPVLASVAVTGPDSSVGVQIFAGPQISFEGGCKVEITAGSTSDEEDCDDTADERQTTDFGVLAGAGVSFPVGDRLSLMISGGVDLGLRTLDSSDDPEDLKNMALFGGVSIGIPLG